MMSFRRIVFPLFHDNIVYLVYHHIIFVFLNAEHLYKRILPSLIIIHISSANKILFCSLPHNNVVISYWKYSFTYEPYLLSVGWLGGQSQFSKKAGNLHFHILIKPVCLSVCQYLGTARFFKKQRLSSCT